MTRYDDLAGGVVVDRANIGSVIAMRDAYFINNCIAQTQHGGHGALSCRHRGLHGAPTSLHKPSRVI